MRPRAPSVPGCCRYRRSCANELEERVPADAVAKDFSQLAGRDHQSCPGDVAGKDRLRQEIHHEPTAEQTNKNADATNEQGKRRRQGEA